VAGKVVEELGVTLATLTTALGVRAGTWAALAGAGPLTPEELAERTGTAPALAREWCRTQAAVGYLRPGATPSSRRPRARSRRRSPAPGSCCCSPTSPGSARPPCSASWPARPAGAARACSGPPAGPTAARRRTGRGRRRWSGSPRPPRWSWCSTTSSGPTNPRCAYWSSSSASWACAPSPCSPGTAMPRRAPELRAPAGRGQVLPLAGRHRARRAGTTAGAARPAVRRAAGGGRAGRP
jgi:hypothetical protein